MQQKIAVVDAGIAADIHDHFVSLELPVGMRQFAGGNTAVVDDVVIGTGFLHDFAGEGERSSRGQDGAAALEAETGGCGDVVETVRSRPSGCRFHDWP